MEFELEDFQNLFRQERTNILTKDNPFAYFVGLIQDILDCQFERAALVANEVFKSTETWHVIPDGASLRSVQVPTITPITSGTLTECQDYIANRN